jgi:hypothetical protein
VAVADHEDPDQEQGGTGEREQVDQPGPVHQERAAPGQLHQAARGEREVREVAQIGRPELFVVVEDVADGQADHRSGQQEPRPDAHGPVAAHADDDRGGATES